VVQHGGERELTQRFRAARRDATLAVLEGFHALKHALRFDAALEIAVTRDAAALARLAGSLAPDLAAAMSRLVRAVEPDLFATLAPVAPPTGVIALARRPFVDPTDILARAGPAPVVLLQRPSDPGNIGAVVRVAAAAGATGVLTTGRHDPWQPAALRGAAGLHFALPVAWVADLPPTDRPIVALDPAGEPLQAEPPPARAVLAFGPERGGLDPALLARAERRIAIPMRPGVSSLNLATAAAVALFAGATGRAS
jgi:TrmH family RNA methyltransferase